MTTEQLLARGRARRQMRSTPSFFRLVRERAGLSQYETAELLGVNQASVSRYEAGKCIPSGKTLDRYAKLIAELDQ